MRWTTVGLIALLAVPQLVGADGGERLTGRDAGLYVGSAGDYMQGKTPFAFTIDQVSRGSDPTRLRSTIERLHANGKRAILDIFLYEKGDEQAKPAAEYMAWLDALLGKLPLDKVYAITLSEENIYWNGHEAMLAELYGLVKAKYPTLAVYQWYSPGAGAPGFGWPLLPADGWLIDEYCKPRDAFENLVKKYVVLDKPLIHIAWAAPGWKEFATWEEVWDDQLAICRRYDVPIAFFCWWPPTNTPAPPGGQSMWSWSAPPGTEHHRVWTRVVLPYVQRLRQGIQDSQDASRSAGRAIPIAGDEQGLYAYHEGFRTSPQFIDDADIEGFPALRWSGARLEVKPDRAATLTYRFESPFTLHDVRAAITADGPDGAITVSVSADGKKWVSQSKTGPQVEVGLPEAAPGDLHGFLVRIELSGKGKLPAALTDLTVTARVDAPAVPQVALTPDKEGVVSFRDDFRSQRYLHAGRVQNPGEIKWQSGVLRMFGKQGYVNEAGIDYHFVSERPLTAIRAKLACAADLRNFGASVALSLSVDGTTFASPVATNTSGKDPYRGELTAALGAEQVVVKDFWVRVKLMNTCGAATKMASPTVQCLTVEARAAAQ